LRISIKTYKHLLTWEKMSSWDSKVIHWTKTSGIAIRFLVSGSKKS